MATLSRALRRWDLMRLASVSLGVAVLTLLLSYAVAVATSSQATSGGVISALALLAIAGSGLLYAWRPGAGGIVD